MCLHALQSVPVENLFNYYYDRMVMSSHQKNKKNKTKVKQDKKKALFYAWMIRDPWVSLKYEKQQQQKKDSWWFSTHGRKKKLIN